MRQDDLADSLRATVTQFIAGHYHDDCMGGINYLHTQGIESLACQLTADKCRAQGLTTPKTTFNERLVLDFNGQSVAAGYLGGGHTIDNIVVWFPAEKILFGGCLVKALSTSNMGNLAEAVIEQWAATLRRTQTTFPEAEIVVLGHGRCGGPELLEHTIQLVEQYQQNH
ncbi:MAG: hypothetical protein KKF80_01715 [Candidatus Omnitrophica bacterium]|nr:hypothetical protein [Candidatus Omnitrophota bacterium]